MMRTGPPDDGGLMKMGQTMQGGRRSLKINSQIISVCCACVVRAMEGVRGWLEVGPDGCRSSEVSRG